MNDLDALLVDPFRRLLADLATPSAVRLAESQVGPPPLWAQIEVSGFLDALVPEAVGGAGLSLADVFPLVEAAGEFALPAPFAETMVARAMLATQGEAAPATAVIVLAPPSLMIPLLRHATHALVAQGEGIALVAIEEMGEDAFRTGGGTAVRTATPVMRAPYLGATLMFAAAAITAARMAGMMARLLAMSVAYACDRQQFGRPLSKFQAIQQQLALMAEHVVSSHVAATIGFSATPFDPVRVAIAKCRVSEASHQIVAIAHAIHGAIGVTEAFDLQLFSRRIKEGQLAFGSESYWAARLGDARLRSAPTNSVDFLRQLPQSAEHRR